MTLLLTIAMPCYNEEACIEEAVREALGVLDTLEATKRGDGELLVIDDGSVDRSPVILAELAALDSRLRIHRHPHNEGIRAFNRSMMGEARGEWVLFTSSDGDFDPYEALRFLDIATEQDADAVLGYRTAKSYSLYRKLVSTSFNALTLLAFGTRFRDIGSIRLLRRSLFQPLPLYSSSAFINAERLLAGKRHGARIAQVPTRHRDRLAGRGKGSSPKRVAEAFWDLGRARVRWFRFSEFYSPAETG